MVLGESQILGQTREALRVGQEAGTIGPALNVLFQQALRVGKRSHAETDIDRVAPSLVGAALERAADHLGGLEGRHVVVVGAGSMAALTVAKVVRAGVASVVVANRTLRARRPPRRASTTSSARSRWPRSARSRARSTCSSPAPARPAPSSTSRTSPRGVRRSARWPSSTWPCRATSTPPWQPARRAADRAGHAGARAPGGAGRRGHRRRAHDRGRGARRLPGRPAQPERHPDGGRAALDGDRRRAGGAGAAGQPAARTSTTTTRAEVERTINRVADKLLHQPTVRVKELANESGAISYAAALAELFSLDPEAVEAVTRAEVERP